MRRILARLKTLWSGDLPLRDAFWDYAVFWGLLINLALSGLALGLLVAKRHTGVVAEDLAGIAVPLAFALHLVPIPYNVLALVGVWRSAARPGVPFVASTLARAATLALFTVFLVI